MVLGIREPEGVRFEAVGGVFLPGGAFENRDPAYFVGAKLRIEF